VSIFLNFTPAILDEPIDDKQRIFENIEHALLDHKGDKITLKSNEVRLLVEKTSDHILGEWRSRFSHFIMVCFVFLTSAVFLS